MRRAAIAVACLIFAPCVLSATLLVLNKEDSTLSFIDPASGKTLATIPTGNGPHEIETTADSRTAVVTNYGGQVAGTSLSIVDISTRRERQRVDLAALVRPHGLAPVGQSMYFTAEDSQSVGRLDVATARVDWRFPTGQLRTHMVVASRDGSMLFTTNMQSNTVSVIDVAPAGDAKQTLIPVGAGPEGMDLSPDGKQLWVANSGSGSVSIVDVVTRKVVGQLDIGTQRSNRLKFTPDGLLALVSDISKGELVLIDVRSRQVSKRISIGAGASGILVSPDGARAYVAASGERKLAVVDLKQMAVSGKIDTGSGPDGMAWVR
jgi:YVTN family beta-propeller protein